MTSYTPLYSLATRPHGRIQRRVRRNSPNETDCRMSNLGRHNFSALAFGDRQICVDRFARKLMTTETMTLSFSASTLAGSLCPCLEHDLVHCARNHRYCSLPDQERPQLHDVAASVEHPTGTAGGRSSAAVDGFGYSPQSPLGRETEPFGSLG